MSEAAECYHVELRRGIRGARSFNMSAGDVRDAILAPWARGQIVELGEQRWIPRECSLTVLAGPFLTGPDLAHGQGWNQARRRGRDVTAELLAAPAAAPTTGRGGGGIVVALLAADPDRERVERLLDSLGLQPVPWEGLRAHILAQSPGDAPADWGIDAAVIVVSEGPGPALDAGLALGALGARAVLVTLGAAAPPIALAGLGILALGSGGEMGRGRLAERLQAVGCDVRPIRVS